jgi:tight adherence protein C
MSPLLAGGLAALAVLVVAVRLRPSPARQPEPTVAAVASAPAAGQSGRRRRVRLVVLAVSVLGLAAVAPPLGALVLAAIVGRRWHRRRVHQRRQLLAIRRGLPDVVDLLVVAVRAGLTPVLALPTVERFAPAPFAAALAEARHRLERGVRFADALDALVEHLGEPVRPIVQVLAAAERDGAPLAPALDLLARDARQDRRRLADEAARTLPVRLCFPLACCTLPAFLLLTIAPLVAGALRSLRL